MTGLFFTLADSVLASMAFVGRVLLSHIRNVQKTRVLSTALRWQQLPASAMLQARMATKTDTSVNEGKQDLR